MEMFQWFNNLPDERQFFIISQWFKERASLTEDEINSFSGIAYFVRQALITTDKQELIQVLVQLGLDDVIAKILVDKIEQTRPTPHMDAEVLNSLPNDVFKQIIEYILCIFYGDYKQVNFENEAEKIGVDKTYFNSVIRIVRDHLIWDFFSGRINRDSSIIKLRDDFRLEEDKVLILIDVLEKNEERLRKQMQFSQVQNLSFRIDELEKLLKVNISILEELLKYLKKVFESKESYSQNIV
jgi:hypothetical protein